MKIKQIHETTEPSLSLNRSDSSSTSSSTWTQKTGNRQTSSKKTSFVLEGSLISSEIAKEQIIYHNHKLVNNHRLLLPKNRREPEIKTVNVSKVNDVKDHGDIIDDNINGKLYLLDKLFESEGFQRKQLNVQGDESKHFYRDEITDESLSLGSIADYACKTKVIHKNPDFTCDDNTESSWMLRTNKIVNSNQSARKIIRVVKPTNKRVKKRTAAKKLNNPKPEWNSNISNENKFTMVLPIINTKNVIRDVYAMNKNTPEVKIKNNVKRNHVASSLINRKKNGEEIERTNKIISNNIINVRSTIPKMKR
jgi:hypothetical protein